jgi:hypothetical protein
VINAALGSGPPTSFADINCDHIQNALDVQLVINAVLGQDISASVDQLAGLAITIYVDCTNFGIQRGTAEAPYNTIAGAVARAQPGRRDIIVVRPGTYTEHIELSLAVKLIGSEGATVTIIKASDTDRPVLTMSDRSAVRGVAVGHAGASSAIMVPQTVRCEVSNCTLFSSGVGLRASAESDITFTNNACLFNELALQGMPTATVSVTNSVFAYNGIGISVEVGPNSSSSYNGFYANEIDIEGGALSSTDKAVDPMFVDAVALYLYMEPDSELVDAGDPAPEYNDHDETRNDLGIQGGPYAVR